MGMGDAPQAMNDIYNAGQRSQWLCDQLQIPEHDREDFIRFAETCLSESDGKLSEHIFKPWAQWASNLNGLLNMDLNGPEDSVLKTEQRAMLENLRIMKAMTAIDPETNLQMFSPPDCGSNAAVNGYLKNISDPQRQMQNHRFKVNLKYSHQEYENKIQDKELAITRKQQSIHQSIIVTDQQALGLFNEKISQLFDEYGRTNDESVKSGIEARIEEMQKNPKKEIQRLREEKQRQLQIQYNETQKEADDRQIQTWQKELQDLQAEKDKLPPKASKEEELRYDVHYGFDAGTFQLDGKSYHLVFETFANTGDQVCANGGSEANVSVGIFKDEKDWQNYYYQYDNKFKKDERYQQISNLRNQLMEKESQMENEYSSGTLPQSKPIRISGVAKKMQGLKQREKTSLKDLQMNQNVKGKIQMYI